ncbi:hypothetical protein GobsT_69890 [Gemmata obscuriglobus]|uniref:Uncharacterized protein n=1 Tax=Gemmata obscuriglobus TaxID=114 RepID=A0A2Z3H512_9BACT|nr:hypothetical protein [Gemmata obscuriglobus]AWM41889.1 hypothetical protein C1280_36120 [Gemmata obscuriglobus]QEG32137.1 hypothetical protein GobsT_69890 [Gemmata obscuriglobus]VTS11490.1 unnamed protein product [Gemmata obscuriglobus UQM 2246]
MSTSKTPANEPIKAAADDTIADTAPIVIEATPKSALPNGKPPERARKPKPFGSKPNNGAITPLTPKTGDKKE